MTVTCGRLPNLFQSAYFKWFADLSTNNSSFLSQFQGSCCHSESFSNSPASAYQIYQTPRFFKFITSNLSIKVLIFILLLVMTLFPDQTQTDATFGIKSSVRATETHGWESYVFSPTCLYLKVFITSFQLQ